MKIWIDVSNYLDDTNHDRGSPPFMKQGVCEIR